MLKKTLSLATLTLLSITALILCGLAFIYLQNLNSAPNSYRKHINMPIMTPSFYGIIYRKSARTAKFINHETKLLLSHFPNAELNENEDLAGFSVAMSSQDLEKTIKKLKEEGLIYGSDFVATASNQGVIDMPEWLSVEESKEYPNRKLYSLVSDR